MDKRRSEKQLGFLSLLRVVECCSFHVLIFSRSAGVAYERKLRTSPAVVQCIGSLTRQEQGVDEGASPTK